MVTAWWRRSHAARWYLNGNAIGWDDSTFSANWAKFAKKGFGPLEISAQSCGEDLMNNGRSKSKGER
jgi:hypothetical protein